MGGSHPPVLLSPDAQLRDQRSITLDVVAAQVVQQATALADEEKKAAPRVVVLLVRLQVLSELPDALREDRDLNLGRARIRVMELVLRNQLSFYFGVDCQTDGRLYQTAGRPSAPPSREARIHRFAARELVSRCARSWSGAEHR